MTFEELKQQLNNSTLKEEDWHQHSNGGGWVQNTAQVDSTAYIGPDAVVMWYAHILDQAQVYGRATVGWHATVSGNAQVFHQVIVTGFALVTDNAKVYEQAHISGKARISGYGRVYGAATVGEDGRVTDYAKVYENAEVWGGIVRGSRLISGNTIINSQEDLPPILLPEEDRYF